MKVLIVAKTRMNKDRVCVGGLAWEKYLPKKGEVKSVRLIDTNESIAELFRLEFEIGDVLIVKGVKKIKVTPPHVEDYEVHQTEFSASMDNPIKFIEQHMPSKHGGKEVLFRGMTRTTQEGALYISKRTGVPDFSTMFWRPNQQLSLKTIKGTKRYVYGDAKTKAMFTLAYVGLPEPVESIPANTLVRVSLARWWRPDSQPDMEKRCYVQLSGWIQRNKGG